MVLWPAIQLNRRHFWVGLIWLLAASAALASAPADRFTRVWKSDDGLINNNILGAVEGADDYLWVAPSVGLMRFDGVTFSQFPIENLTARTIHTSAPSSAAGPVWYGLPRMAEK